jgi:3-methyladenine DNA glycosylase AlkD
MDDKEILEELKRLGTDQNVKIYKRHGAGENLYGVSFANLKQLKKKIKTDNDLATRLWSSQNVDAQTLATMISDPSQASEKMIEDWLKDISYYTLIDSFVSNLVSQTDIAKAKMELWTKSEEEWVGRAGWQLLALLAMKDESLTDNYLEKYLNRIEKRIHKSKNRTRDAMNSALIAIGMRNTRLKNKAMATAKRIGKVEVDHGQTNCKTPDATAYIEKAWKRKKK